MLQSFSGIQSLAFANGLIPLVVASPDLGQHYQQGARSWIYGLDEQLIHELLQSELKGQVAFDFEKVIFSGASQGAPFAHRFILSYGEHYGGGLLGLCGDYAIDPLWNPTQELKDRFRVVISATTEDHVYERARRGYGYYKYIYGFETRGDLQSPGGHCAPGAISSREAVPWLLDGVGIPDSSTEPHFTRVSTFDFVAGLSVDPGGALWMAQQAPDREEVSIWRTVDKGANWEAVSRVPIAIDDIDAVGNSILLTPSSHNEEKPLYRSIDGGKSFEQVGMRDGSHLLVSEPLVADANNKLYVIGRYPGEERSSLYTSDDSGDNWSLLNLPEEYNRSRSRNWRIGNPDTVALKHPGRLVLRTDDEHVYDMAIGALTGNDWRLLSDTSAGWPIWGAWDGSSVWALGSPHGARGALFQSLDEGFTWLEQELSGQDYRRIATLGEGQLLVLSENDALVRSPAGSWTLVYGSPESRYSHSPSDLWDNYVVADFESGDVYATERRGVFRLGPEFSLLQSRNRPDGDGDGVPDSIDAFPSDRSEYLDTDGDGIGNNEDDDSDGDGVNDDNDGAPLDRFETVDTDRDGMGDGIDLDDDGDRVWDVLDAFPNDRNEQFDLDGDGVGDRQDPDDDGDGIDDVVDAFPRYPDEWMDSDDDGIGNNADTDDDNDGIVDDEDDLPLSGERLLGYLKPASRYQKLDVIGLNLPYHPLVFHQQKPSSFIYPEASGTAQQFGFIQLGDTPAFHVQFMVDDFGWRLDAPPNAYLSQDATLLAKIYVDRNGNGDLTDDGAPVISSTDEDHQGGVGGPVFGADVGPLEVPYLSGETVPYSLSIRQYVIPKPSNRPVSFGGSWVGDAALPDGTPVLVQTVDYDIDGIFNGSPVDFVCIDTNGDRRLNCKESDPERFVHDEAFEVDGQALRARVAPSGHRLELVDADMDVLASLSGVIPLFMSASHGQREGFVRVINHSDVAGDVSIVAVDDEGSRSEPVQLTISPMETVNFNSLDLETGNAEKELTCCIGMGSGDWRLEMYSDLNIEAIGYVRTSDGFVTGMQDVVEGSAGRYEVPIFNPGSNREQKSSLRIVNAGEDPASISITGTDDAGMTPGTLVRLEVPAGASRTLASIDLESGAGVDGGLGDGTGKWRLIVESDQPVIVMSLLSSPTGHLTNLSTFGRTNESGGHTVPLFPSASNPQGRQGFVRVVNRSAEAGEVQISSRDDSGTTHDPITLSIGAGETGHFNSKDLESGNDDKGLSAGTGAGVGDWWLELSSGLEIDVMGYIRTEDGFLTSMHDVAPLFDGEYWVPTFNPGSNTNQVSRLRMINMHAQDAPMTIVGTDDSGASPGMPVQFVVPAGASRTISAADLEAGGEELAGALGNGTGKWRLQVTSDRSILMMSLLSSPTGHLTNLSTAPERP